MKPEDVNRLNKRNNTIEKVYKFCPKCNEIKLVSCYVSKCPVCKTQFENCKQPTQSNIPKCPTCGSTKIKKNIRIKSCRTWICVWSIQQNSTFTI